MRCTGCGKELADDVHDRCRRRAPYEPPRFCALCGRRMVVQVTPLSYTATCSVHGETSPDPRRDRPD
ncbi:MAG TPA: hypothetical protein VG899_00985 [Mycobacteriales bacterium]|nr:hypothetical protein [Mycobacteriales bacterium]